VLYFPAGSKIPKVGFSTDSPIPERQLKICKNAYFKGGICPLERANSIDFSCGRVHTIRVLRFILTVRELHPRVALLAEGCFYF